MTQQNERSTAAWLTQRGICPVCERPLPMPISDEDIKTSYSGRTLNNRPMLCRGDLDVIVHRRCLPSFDPYDDRLPPHQRKPRPVTIDAH